VIAVRRTLLLLLVSSAGAQAQQELSVSCAPERPERGAVVTCSARLEPSSVSFRVVERRAAAGGHSLVEQPGDYVPARSEARWSGPAVLDTEVTFVAEAAGRTLQGSASFVVRPRAWSPPAPAKRSLPWAWGSAARYGKAPRLSPSSTADEPIPATGALVELDLSLRPPRWAVASEGPNARWAFATEPPPPMGARALLHPALAEGSDFALLQHGDLSLPTARLWPRCRRADLAPLRERLLSSVGAGQEGSAADSQLAAAIRSLAGAREELAALEGLHAWLPAPAKFTAALRAATDELLDLAAAGARRAPMVKLPCSLRYPN